MIPVRTFTAVKRERIKAFVLHPSLTNSPIAQWSFPDESHCARENLPIELNQPIFTLFQPNQRVMTASGSYSRLVIPMVLIARGQFTFWFYAGWLPIVLIENKISPLSPGCCWHRSALWLSTFYLPRFFPPGICNDDGNQREEALWWRTCHQWRKERVLFAVRRRGSRCHSILQDK